MPLYELTHDALTELARTTMAEQNFRERYDLQRHLRGSIGVIDKNLLVLAEEFSQWEDSRRRIDLLALDKQANLVVIELKRTEDGGFMDLQAIRYAAMVSAMTFQQAVTHHAKFLGDPANLDDAKSRILNFLEWETPNEDFASQVRVILASADFSIELTTAVLWLNDNGLDIRCVRLRPYALEGRTILEAQQIIPIPDAEDIRVRFNDKREEIRQVKQAKLSDYTHYDLTVGTKVFRDLGKRHLVWQVVRSAIDLCIDFDWLRSVFPSSSLLATDGELSSAEFLKATVDAKTPTGALFDQGRFFTGEDQLFRVKGRTYALTKMWGISCLPLLDEIIGQLPAGSMSYGKTEEGI